MYRKLEYRVRKYVAMDDFSVEAAELSRFDILIVPDITTCSAAIKQ